MKKICAFLLLFATNAWAQSPCKIGDYLFYDGSCGSKIEENKYPIAVIFAPVRRVAVSLNQEIKEWATTEINIEIAPPKGFMKTKSQALQEFSGIEIVNSIEQAAPNFYPAVMYCAAINQVDYKAWYLPEAGLLNQIYQNKEAINNALNKLSGSDLISNNSYWSASQYSYSQAWRVSMMNGFLGYNDNNDKHVARCVINY